MFVCACNEHKTHEQTLKTKTQNTTQLLDHDDIAQECGHVLSPLVSYLAQRDVVEKLIRYVIAKPPETKDEKTQLAPKYVLFDLCCFVFVAVCVCVTCV